jgi:hypothetical protein
VVILLMIVGGGAGSTAGGVKQYRVDVLLKGLVHDVRGRLRSRRVVNEAWLWRAGERRFLTPDDLVQAGLFVALYLAVLAIGTAILTAYGFTLPRSLFEFASALGTVGLSVGVTAPAAPDGVLWSETVGMLLGRLEFFTVFVALARIASDLRNVAATRSGPGPATVHARGGERASSPAERGEREREAGGTGGGEALSAVTATFPLPAVEVDQREAAAVEQAGAHGRAPRVLDPAGEARHLEDRPCGIRDIG